MTQRYTIQAVIYSGDESGYVAECLNLAVVTQGKTLDETMKNLREAIQLHLEGEDLQELGLAPDPPVVVTMEMGPVYAKAAPSRHDELDTGTLRAILRQASQYIPDAELRPHFYAE